MKNITSVKYVIRIYDTKYPPYVSYGKVPEDIQPVVKEFAQNEKELIKKIKKLIEEGYEEYGYTIYDIELDKCIAGGFNSLDLCFIR